MNPFEFGSWLAEHTHISHFVQQQRPARAGYGTGVLWTVRRTCMYCTRPALCVHPRIRWPFIQRNRDG